MHVIGPELGLTQPGMTIACGDSHTATHGAVGAIAFGIGTSQVRDVLATQCLAMAKPKLRQVRVDGALAKGVYAKDVILAIIRTLGVNGRRGLRLRVRGPRHRPHDHGGAAHPLQHVHRGRRALRLRQPGPDHVRLPARAASTRRRGAAFDRAVTWWKGMASDPDATYDDVKRLDGSAIAPMVTWGINPGQSVGVGERIPNPESAPEQERATYREGLAHMGFEAGQPIAGAKIDVVFIGSCTNSRISDLRVAADGGPGQPGGQGGRGPSWCRARSRWPRTPRPRACTRSSARRASSGATPAARCASA